MPANYAGIIRVGLADLERKSLGNAVVDPAISACDEWQIGAQENATADLASAMKVARELSYL